MSLTKLPGYTLDNTSNVTFANATVTGNIAVGNANLGNLVIANYFSGNGSLLTGVDGTYSNANVAAYLASSNQYATTSKAIALAMVFGF